MKRIKLFRQSKKNDFKIFTFTDNFGAEGYKVTDYGRDTLLGIFPLAKLVSQCLNKRSGQNILDETLKIISL